MATTGRKRMLIVDDDEANLIGLESRFETLGYDTTTAWDGREALKALRAEDFDVVLLDDFLPEAPSEAILRAIRELPVQPWVALLRTRPSPGEPTHERRREAADCSASKRSIGAIVDSIQECLAHTGSLAVRDFQGLAAPRA